MELESGIQDDFTEDETAQGEHEGQQNDAEFDLTQPLIAYGEGDGEVKLTGQELIDKFSNMQAMEQELADLREKAKAPVQVQQPAYQPVQPQQGQQADPIAQIRTTAQDALTRFANGDMEAIPVLLDAIGQFAEARAQGTAGQVLSEQQRESQFVAAHPEIPDAINSREFAEYRQKNGYYMDGVQAFLGWKLENQAKAHANEIATLKAQIAGANAQGKKEGEQQTLKAAKAAGGLRILVGGGSGGGSGGGKPSGQNGGKIKAGASLDEITEAMKTGLAQMRGGSLD